MQKRDWKIIWIITFLLVIFGVVVFSQEENKIIRYQIRFEDSKIISEETDFYKQDVSSAFSEKDFVVIKDKKSGAKISVDSSFSDGKLLDRIIFSKVGDDEKILILFNEPVQGIMQLIVPISGGMKIIQAANGVLIKSNSLMKGVEISTSGLGESLNFDRPLKDLENKVEFQDMLSNAKNFFYFLNYESNILLIDKAELRKAGIADNLGVILASVKSPSIVIMEAYADENKRVIFNLEAKKDAKLDLGKAAVFVESIPFQRLTLKTSFDVREFSPEDVQALLRDIEENEKFLKDFSGIMKKFQEAVKELEKIKQTKPIEEELKEEKK